MTSTSLLKLRVLRAAQAWWENKRPAAWSLEEHLKNPGINCTEGEIPRKLACAVGALMKESWRDDDATPLVRELYDLVQELRSGKKRTIDLTALRKAEAFLGLREVSDNPQPVQRSKARGRLHA